MGNLFKKVFLILFIILISVSSAQAFGTNDFFTPPVKVLDQNMYFGADVTPLLVDLKFIPDVLKEFIASNYPARAEAFARMIKLLEPDVVCLQQALIFQILQPDDGQLVPISAYYWDFKHLLLYSLGDDYYEVVTNKLF